MKQVLDAVEKVHKKNIIHRDIKPDNVMLIRKNGDDKFVKLLDFGLATMEYQTRLTQTGMVVGTINYMAPEQITESITSKATDIYSLGVMLYEMVAGRRPYAGESTIALMKQIIDENPIEPIKFRIDISKRLNDLIVKMMNKDSSKRPTLSEIIDTINTL
jgi:serine/threonine-protein kinase